jgi:septal ring factor EnvC (AmiA/AmiB activator)
MTSVLYSAGLNYQGSNPLRTEIRGIRNEVEELRKLIVNQADAINGLNSRLISTEKALKAATASIATAAASSTNTTAPSSG